MEVEYNYFTEHSYSKQKDKTNIHALINEGIFYKVEDYIKKKPYKINDENSIGETVLDRALYLYVYNKENSNCQSIFKERAEAYKKIIELLLLNKETHRKKDIISYHQIGDNGIVLKTKKALDIIKDFKQSN